MDRELLSTLLRPVPGVRLSRSAARRLDEAQSVASPLPDGPSRPGLHGSIPQRLIPEEKRLAALIAGGAPAWAVRLKRIEMLTDRALDELATDWRAIARRHRHRAEAFAEAWRAQVAGWDFSKVNELIRRHNLYFPAEANLAMNPRTSDFIGWGGREWRRAPLTPSWALARFPAVLASAAEPPPGRRAEDQSAESRLPG